MRAHIRKEDGRWMTFDKTARVIFLSQSSLLMQQGGNPSRKWGFSSTHLRSTAISFSMLVSFPFSAFLGMHLIATIFSVAFSCAITTSENAPLREEEREKTSPLYVHSG